MKPTYGRVSRRGVVPLAQSLDHIGPMTRNVRDNALLLQAVAGHDPLDPGSADEPVDDYLAVLDTGVRGLRIGVVRHFHTEDCEAHPEQAAAVEASLGIWRDAGAVIDDDAGLARTYERQARMPFNLTGYPALVIPAGFTRDLNLPLSLQIVGHPFEEATVYRIAQVYENATGWVKQHPPLG